MANYAGQDPTQRPDPAVRDIEQAAAEGRERVSDYADRAKQQAEAGIDRAAEGVSRLAGRVRAGVAGQEGMAAEAERRLADGMERTAGYLREHDTGDIAGDVETYVRKHPMQALAGAVIGGFLIGRMLR